MRSFIKYLFILFPVVAIAQPRLTLKDAINVALKNNFDIQIAQSNVDINTINNDYGVAGGLPVVTGAASDQESVVNINQKLNTGTSIDRNAAASNALSANVTGSILLFNGYRVIATKKRLEQLENQSQQLLNSQVQNTIAAISVKYYDVIRQESYMKTLLQSIEVSKKQLEIIEAKQAVGLANNADLFQAKIDLNTRQQDLQTQELILQQATSDLLNLMSSRPDSAVTVKDTIVVKNDIKLEDILNLMNKNPDLISADQQIRINELIEKETAALRYPSIRGNAGLSYGRTQSDAGNLLLNQSYGPFVGVSVAVPIFNGGIYKKQQQTAEINTRISRIQKESVQLNLQTSATKSYQAYINNLEQLKTQQATYDLSAQLVDLTLQRFELSQATIIEVREAQKSFEDAGYRLVNLSYAAKVAEVELLRLASQLGL